MGYHTRWIAGAVVTAVSALALAGCASSEEGDGKIVYWATNQAASISLDEEIFAESVARFTAETGVEVEVEVIPWADLYNRILTAVSSGEGPDVLNIGNTWAVPLQATDAFIPWEGEALEAIGGAGRFLAPSWESGGAAGSPPTSVPLFGYAYSLYYNTVLFEEEGIQEPPTTWDEFVQVAQRLTKDTDGDGSIDQWGVTVAGANGTANAHAAFILGLQNGGPLYDEEGRPDFANDGVVAGVNQWVQLMGENGVVDPANAETSSGLADELAAGRAAMLLSQAPAVSFEALGFEDWAAAPVPMPSADATGDEGTQSHVGGINVSVFANSANLEAAIDFVAHLTSDEEQKYLNAAFTTLPVVAAAYDDPAFDSDEIRVKQVTLAEHAQPMPLYLSQAQAESLIGSTVSELFARIALGQTVTEDDVRSALESATEEMSDG